LLAVEMRGWAMPLVSLIALIAAVPGALASPGWGWLLTAIMTAASVWALEEWRCRASKLS
jgi:hypothetical protein